MRKWCALRSAAIRDERSSANERGRRKDARRTGLNLRNTISAVCINVRARASIEIVKRQLENRTPERRDPIIDNLQGMKDQSDTRNRKRARVEAIQTGDHDETRIETGKVRKGL